MDWSEIFIIVMVIISFVSMLIMLGLAFWRAIRGKWETSLAWAVVLR
ncbi:hypothetical protein [Candidatus Endomicrobiellum trichonymphae]|nr:hypothetical protein [Candidatus Endomicrobium trichonymphae]